MISVYGIVMDDKFIDIDSSSNIIHTFQQYCLYRKDKKFHFVPLFVTKTPSDAPAIKDNLIRLLNQYYDHTIENQMYSYMSMPSCYITKQGVNLLNDIAETYGEPVVGHIVRFVEPMDRKTLSHTP